MKLNELVIKLLSSKTVLIIVAILASSATFPPGN